MPLQGSSQLKLKLSGHLTASCVTYTLGIMINLLHCSYELKKKALNIIYFVSPTMCMSSCFAFICVSWWCFLRFLYCVVKWLQSQHQLQSFYVHQAAVTLFLKKLKCGLNEDSKWFPLFITEGILDKFDKSRKRDTILT